jgi:ribosome-binding factor A
MSIRTERVAGEIQQALGRLFQTDFSSLSDGMLTVTKVRMAADLKSGRVYVSILGGTLKHDAVLKAIKAETPRVRAALARLVRMKFVPDLHFYIDDTQEEVARVEEIFRRIGKELRPAADSSVEVVGVTSDSSEKKEEDVETPGVPEDPHSAGDDFSKTKV